MSISVQQLKHLNYIDKVIIHSHDFSLYLASIILDGYEHYIVDKNNKPITAFNKQELLDIFQYLNVAYIVLRQDSAYDEMIGLPGKAGTNRLEVELGSANLDYSEAT